MTDPSARWKQGLYHASRSRSFLWKFALVTIFIGVGIGFGLSRVQPHGPDRLGERALATAGLTEQREDSDTEEVTESAPKLLDALAGELTSPSVKFVDALRAMPAIAPYIASIDLEQIGKILKTRFTDEEVSLSVDYLAAWQGRSHAAFDRLSARADNARHQRYASYALGRVELKNKHYSAAYIRFRQEADTMDSEAARYMAVQALAEAKDYVALEKLESDAQFGPYIDSYVRMKMAAGRRDWVGLAKWVAKTQFESYGNAATLVAIVAGLSWGFFLFHLGEVSGIVSKTAALCFVGFVAGVISTLPTIYLVVVEEDILQFSKGDDVVHAFAYFIAGVGAREELCKILLFVPLLPFLIRRGDELEVLLVASFVGLGFAIEENGGYFALSAAASAPGRFLTANFFHIALTGLNGLALFRACTRGMSGINQLMLILPATIVVHGAYDALLEGSQVNGGGFFAMGIYVGFALYYFTHVHPLRNNERMTVSLTGSFIFGISILSATVIAFQMATLGASAGASLIFSELIGSAVLLFLFFREFNEPLTT